MVIEIESEVGENTLCYLVNTYGIEIECRSNNGHKDKDDIIKEERSEHNECRTMKFLVSSEEIEQQHQHYHRIVGGVAEIHQFAEDVARYCL